MKISLPAPSGSALALSAATLIAQCASTLAGQASHVVFTKVGQTVHVLEYANVKIPIQLHATLKSIEELETALHSHQKKQAYARQSADWQRREFQIMAAQRLRFRMEALISTLDRTQTRVVKHRGKRFFFVLAIMAILAAAAAGSSYAIYHNHELSKMGQNQNTLAAAEAAALRYVGKAGTSQRELAHLVQGTVHEVDRVYGLLETSKWDEAALGVATSDWLQHETSFIATEGGYDLYVHIPLMGKDSGMDIHRHVRLPIPLDGDYHLNIEAADEYIAVTSDGALFRAISAADLADCRKYGDFFACDRGNVVRRAPEIGLNQAEPTKDGELCLWALFYQKYALAREVCDMTISPQVDMVKQLAPNTFALFSSKPHQGQIICRNKQGDQKRTFSAHAVNLITLDPGCAALTDTHVFSTSDVAFTRDAAEWMVQFDWPYSSAELSHNLNTSEFHRLRISSEHEFFNQSRVPLMNALRAVTAANFLRPASPVTSFFAEWPTLTAVIPGGAATLSCLALFLIVFLAYRHYRLAQSLQHLLNQSPVPPAMIPPPPAIQYIQPPRIQNPFTNPIFHTGALRALE
jgi:hypothetical protein